MTERDSEHEEKQALIQRVDKMEVLLKQVANALANSTNYATMVSSPHYQNVTLKFVQLSQVDHACSDRYTRQYRKEQDDSGRRTAFE